MYGNLMPKQEHLILAGAGAVMGYVVGMRQLAAYIPASGAVRDALVAGGGAYAACKLGLVSFSPSPSSE